jgi:ABC-type uncharacterized transport system substrate-binding protein
MRTVAILNSYNLPGRSGRQTRRVQEFVRALAEEGWEEGRNLKVELVDSEDPRQTASAAGRLAAQGVDLIHAVGTPNTVAAMEALAAVGAASEVPIVYYGAHPEGIGDSSCRSANVTGEILALPFTSNYKRFRLLRRFLPRVTRVWTPFYQETVFVRPRMREVHGAARERAGRRAWLRGEDEEVGFRTLAGLAYVIDVRYRELVYSDSGELERALDEVDPRDGVLMPYNESFHCPGALETLLRVARERRIPLIWNNNAQVTTIGALSGISADFEKLGRTCGKTAAAVLAGARPRDLPRRLHDDQIAWLNLDVADHLGLDLSAEALGDFDRRIQGESDALCM